MFTRAEIITALHTALEGSPRCWPPRWAAATRPGAPTSSPTWTWSSSWRWGPSRLRSTPCTARWRSCRRSPDGGGWRIRPGTATPRSSCPCATPTRRTSSTSSCRSPPAASASSRRNVTAPPSSCSTAAGILTPVPLDRDALQTRIDARLAILRERFPLFQTLVTRAVRRGFVAEAAVAYQDHTYRPLIEVLRIRHCPERYDFGARYLDRDLPPALRAEVEALALPGFAGRGGVVQGPRGGPVRRDVGRAVHAGVTRAGLRSPGAPAPARRRPRRCRP